MPFQTNVCKLHVALKHWYQTGSEVSDTAIFEEYGLQEVLAQGPLSTPFTL